MPRSAPPLALRCSSATSSTHWPASCSSQIAPERAAEGETFETHPEFVAALKFWASPAAMHLREHMGMLPTAVILAAGSHQTTSRVCRSIRTAIQANAPATTTSIIARAGIERRALEIRDEPVVASRTAETCRRL